MKQVEIVDILSTAQQLAHVGYLTHTLCTGGTATLLFNGGKYTVRRSDCVIVHRSELLSLENPSPDFQATTVYVQTEFIQLATPQSNYGMRGQFMLFNDPVMHLSPEQAERCFRNFEVIRERAAQTAHRFYQQIVANAVQAMILDFFDFHVSLYGMDEVITSPQADLLQRFLQLLEDKNYYEHRDIGWYADKLCVTPKYLSETTKAISGFAANYWIDRYTALEISRLLPQQQLSIADIAYKMNFSSISHFTRFVRTQLGIRPTDLRQ